MSVSFVGLNNSSFNSGNLITQLVNLETRNKIAPLQKKVNSLQTENSFLSRIGSNVSSVINDKLNLNSIIKGTTSLAPKKITSSDTNSEFSSVTTTDAAVQQSFQLNIAKLASQTIRRSEQSISLGITTASSLDKVNLKGFSNINSGTVTIGNETKTYTEATKTILKSASSIIQPPDITVNSILNDANFKDGLALTSGTVTINGDTKTYSPNTVTDTVQSLLDFIKTFSGVTNATLADGKIKIEGITSITAGTSNFFDALGITNDSITNSTVTGSKNITEHTLEDYGINGTTLTVNGKDITFDPHLDSINSLITKINDKTGLEVTASYDITNNKFVLTNDTASTNPITISSSDSNFVSVFSLTDQTLGEDNSVSRVLDFIKSFSSVTSADLINGHIQVNGSFTSVGASGNTSNLIRALGLDNAPIVSGSLTGVQNLDAAKNSALLSSIGITGTTLTINGADITYNPASDTIQTLINKINNTASAKANAAYDSLNGKIVLTNNDTGALSLTISSNGDITGLKLTGTNSQTLGNNAEFTISTLNGGSTLVSNSNTVTGLLDGVTLDLKKVTTNPVNISINKDSSSYQEKLKNAIDGVNKLIVALSDQDNSFSRSFISRIKSVLSSISGVSGTDTYTSFIEVGLTSNLDASTKKFTGFSLDTTKFNSAFNSAPDELNKILWGSPDPDSKFPTLSNGDKGILVKLNDLLKSYQDPINGTIKTVSDSVGSQIKSTNANITRTQASIDAYEERLKKQFSQLDTLNAGYQQQQNAVAALSRKSQ